MISKQSLAANNSQEITNQDMKITANYSNN